VPCLSDGDLQRAFPPPYDLIKVDIEGAEYDFVARYPGVCAAARALVVEWHAPSAEDGRVAGLCRELAARGFAQSAVLRPPHRAAGVLTGLELFWRPDANR
jgi:hypothetical protein